MDSTAKKDLFALKKCVIGSFQAVIFELFVAITGAYRGPIPDRFRQ